MAVPVAARTQNGDSHSQTNTHTHRHGWKLQIRIEGKKTALYTCVEHVCFNMCTCSHVSATGHMATD